MESNSNNNEESRPSPHYILEYYQRPFLLIHYEHSRSSSDFFLPHPIRQRFWQLVPPGEYNSQEANSFLQSYLTSVESLLGELIGKLSLIYCLHLYRRLSPGPVGRNEQPYTIGLTRAILESAIQKYALHQPCNKIAESATVPIDRVLGGLLMSPEFEGERNHVIQNNQWVLTDFTSSDLTAFYNLEKLAYEIWKTSAVLRAVGKGAPLIVYDEDEYFADGRSDELDLLLVNYDDRLGKTVWSTTSTGVVFTDEDSLSTQGIELFPIYNVGGVTSNDFKEFFSKAYQIALVSDVTYNFVWTTYNLREYRKAHLPFADAFSERYDVSLDAVLAVVAALSIRVFRAWHDTRGMLFFRYFQRAYEICTIDFIRDEIFYILPAALEALELDKTSVNSNNIEAAIAFWSLDSSNQHDIDLSYPGPHSIFLPIQSNGTFLIDYAWILRRLYDLFRYVHLSNQNFKGDALERIISIGKSVLPTKPCKSLDGYKRQIDYAIPFGSYLIITECKAVNMSIGYDRGDPYAIEFRKKNVVERSLTEVDDKAKWLAAHPVGLNYDVSTYSHILPIAISPFVEFMPSKNTRYWLTNDIPRVLTPGEFNNFISTSSNVDRFFNLVPLNQ